MKHLKSKKAPTAGNGKAPSGTSQRNVPTSNPDRSPTNAPLPVAERRMVAYGLVRPDPGQPRKTFSESSLDEMAGSIHAQGILQDLAVEHFPDSHRLLEKDLHRTSWQVERRLPDGTWELAVEDTEENCRWSFKEMNVPEHYLLVYGERRWRGAGRKEYRDSAGQLVKWDGLAELPCKVYTNLSLKDRGNMQAIENAQRENVTQLEQARAFMGLLAERQKTEPELSVDDLAKEQGVKRATAYELRKLTKLHPETEEALVSGKISTSVACEVAKAPTPDMQGQILKVITNEQSWDFPYSVRDVQKLMDEKFMKQLSAATFKPGQVYEPEAKGLASTMFKDTCTVCPHRSGNMLAEFPELKSKPHVCTRPECFAAKTDAAWKIRQGELAIEGTQVITEEQYRKKSDEFVKADDYNYRTAGPGASWGKLMGKHKPKPVIMMTEEGPLELFPKNLALLALKANGVQMEGGGGGNDAYRKKQLARQKKEKAMKAEAGGATVQILKKVIIGTDPTFSKAIWKHLAQGAYDATDIEKHDFVAKRRGLSEKVTESREALQTWLEADHTSKEYAEFVLELLLCSRWSGGGYQEVKYGKKFLELCNLAGGAPEKLAAQAEKEMVKPAGKNEHEWEKTDLVSGFSTNYKCKRCGVKAVRSGFDWPPKGKGVTEVCVLNGKSVAEMSPKEFQRTLDIVSPSVIPKSFAKKFTMSPSAMAKIAAAAKARWAKVKAAKKG